MSGIYKCHDCHMSFGTMQLLNKHKRKFCIGGSIGDPDNLMLRRPLRSIESPPPVSPTESVRRPRHKVIDEKVGELKALKERVNKKHDIRNLEERILLDELQDADRKLGIVSPVYRSKSKLPPSRYKDVRKLQEEYESLQDQENIRQRSPLPPTQRKSRASSAMTDTSMSIHLDDEEYSRYNPNQDARAQQLAETHGRQMEYLSLRNRDLEKQRDDIRRRLEQLGTKGVKVDPDNTQQLLEELRAQERRNQLALEELRRQLMNINQPRVNVIEVEKPVIQQPPPPPPPPPQESSRKSYIYPVYYGNSLVAEISALRQAYMQNGGNDIELLDHMSQLQAEAQAIEEAMRKQGMEKQRAPKEKKDVSDHLKTLEFENERLQRELMLLQNLKLKQKNDREGKSYDKSVKRSKKYLDKLDSYYDKYQTKTKKKTDSNKASKSSKLEPYKIQSKPYIPPLDLKAITEVGETITGEKTPHASPVVLQKENSNLVPGLSHPYNPYQQTYMMNNPSSYPFSYGVPLYKPPAYPAQGMNIDLNPRLNPNDLYNSLRRGINSDQIMKPDYHYGMEDAYRARKSKTLDLPRQRRGSYKSLRSEIVEGVKEPRYHKGQSMLKASFSNTDLIRELETTDKEIAMLKAEKSYQKEYEKPFLPSRESSLTSFFNANKPKEKQYKAMAIQQQDEIHPSGNQIRSTFMYKEQRILQDTQT